MQGREVMLDRFPDPGEMRQRIVGQSSSVLADRYPIIAGDFAARGIKVLGFSLQVVVQQNDIRPISFPGQIGVLQDPADKRKEIDGLAPGIDNSGIRSIRRPLPIGKWFQRGAAQGDSFLEAFADLAGSAITPPFFDAHGSDNGKECPAESTPEGCPAAFLQANTENQVTIERVVHRGFMPQRQRQRQPLSKTPALAA